MNARLVVGFLAVAIVATAVGPLAMADPYPDEILKFQQLPLNNGLIPVPHPGPAIAGAPYYGHDELSTATRTNPNTPWQGVYMADDFADKFNTPVVHVRWWGSYLDEQIGNPTNPFVKQFLISFESDVAADDPNNTLGYSHPGVPLLNQIVTRVPVGTVPPPGTFTEKIVPTPVMPGMAPREALYEYNAELNLEKYFPQKPDTVYWLKIVALVDAQQDGVIQWGWHDRDWSIMDPLASTPPAVSPGERTIGGVFDPEKSFESPVWHFQDDAVSGGIVVFPDPAMPNMPSIEQNGWTPQRYLPPWDGPSVIGQYSKDLAFELYTRVPEPATLGLLLVGAIALSPLRRRSLRPVTSRNEGQLPALPGVCLVNTG